MVSVAEKNRHNYFKMVEIVLDVVSDALRNVFKDEWKTRHLMPWNDDRASLTRFSYIELAHTPVARMTATAKRSYNNLMATSGDTKEWDITLLCYTLLFAHAVKLNKTTAVGGAVDTLRDIRNKIMHRNKPELTDVEFKLKYKEVKAEMLKFGAVCQPQLNQIKAIKQEPISPEVITKLQKQVAKEQKQRQKERLLVLICGFLISGSLISVICILYLYFVPPFIPSYFPDYQVTPYVTGRENIVEQSLDAFLTGTRIVVLNGPVGIGKRTTALVIGRRLQEIWFPFPWFCVCYVSLHGVRQVEGMLSQILRSFYVETKMNVAYDFREFMTHSLKRKTFIILDGGQELFELDRTKESKEMLSQMLEWNRNIYILIIHVEKMYFVEYKVENLRVEPLSNVESQNLVKRIVSDIPDETAINVAEHLSGFPVFIQTFSLLLRNISDREKIVNILTVLQPIQTNSVCKSTNVRQCDANFCEIINSFVEMCLDSSEKLLLYYMSLFPGRCPMPALEMLDHDVHTILLKLIEMGAVENTSESKAVQSYALQSAFKMVTVCNVDSELYLIYMKKNLQVVFTKYYISEAVSHAEKFLLPDFDNWDYFPTLTSTSPQNLHLMLSDGLFEDELNVEYKEMLIKTSIFFAYQLHTIIFSQNVYNNAALVYKDYNLGRYLSIIYILGDRGDIYNYNHQSKNDKALTSLQDIKNLMNIVTFCESFDDGREEGMCFLVKARSLILGIHSSETTKADLENCFRLVDIAVDIFASSNMSSEVAEAYSFKGLVRVILEKQYAKGVVDYENALKEIKRSYVKHPVLAACFFNIGYMYFKMGGFNLMIAIQYFNTSYAMFNSTLANHGRTANSLFYIGKSLQEIGKYKESMGILATAFAIQQEVIKVHTDIWKAPMDKAVLTYMKYLHDNAMEFAHNEVSILYNFTNKTDLWTSFKAYKYGNTHKCLGNRELQKHYHNISKHVLLGECSRNQKLIMYYHLIQDDLDVIDDVTENVQDNQNMNWIFSIGTAIIVLCFTVCFFYFYKDRYWFIGT